MTNGPRKNGFILAKKRMAGIWSATKMGTLTPGDTSSHYPDNYSLRAIHGAKCVWKYAIHEDDFDES